ncbi:MAG: acetyl-CoA carboxylase biotin carboxyl carrier protein [Flavobacteriaceae bacterium]
MDIKEIQNLIKFVAKSGAQEVKLEMDDFKITIKTKGADRTEGTAIVQQVPVALPAPAAVEQTALAETPPVKTQEVASPEAAEDNLITIKSPMIGTFYRKASPDKPVFVEVGDMVKPGDVLCVVEAMKLFNEIESEISGKVVKILADDATPIEFDQPLFVIDPS